MRILYIASAITLPGRSGGATHVREVAEGLAALGHELHVVAHPGDSMAEIESWGWRVVQEGGETPEAEVTRITYYVPPPLAARLPDKLAFLLFPFVDGLAAQIGADVVMERFYNFAGAGALVAEQRKLPYVLEVNAPMIDPPSSLKSKIDGLLFGSLRRWAVRQANVAERIVTPLNSTVPPEVYRGKIVELPWGANVDRFTPRLRQERVTELTRLRGRLGIPQDATVAVFVGSFRAWHGVQQFAEAATILAQSHPDLYFLAVGGGPERKHVRDSVKGRDANLVFTGPQKHERVPALLSLADIGVAPFVPDAYEPLKEFGFYWSPLKVFEYMATGLPIVTIDVPPLNEIVRHEHEGLLYPQGDEFALAETVAQLADDEAKRKELGQSARKRVVEQYSWAEHCKQLEQVLEAAIEEQG